MCIRDRERSKIEEELAALMVQIGELEAILADEGKLLSIIKEEANEIKEKYGDDRRTEIAAVSGEVAVSYTHLSPAELAGSFCCVIFSPAHLSIVKEGPSVRRRFLDGAICQVRPRYIHVLYQYKKALSQKNAVLKELYKRCV